MKTHIFKISLLVILYTCVSVNARLVGQTPTLPNAWINELHYDNDGGDTGEMVEVVIENAGDYTLSDFTVTLYNGNNGELYGTYTLDGFTSGEVSGNYTVFSSGISGIQNGSPDGLALSYNSDLIQFLSYEGEFTAVGGPADGIASENISVSEPGNTTIGFSLQLMGTGSHYSDFIWAGPILATQGSINTSQSFTTPTEPSLSVSPSALDDFIYVVGSGPSAHQTFTVAASNLTNLVIVHPPTNYEISVDGSTFQSTDIMLPHTLGEVNADVYVRLKEGLAAGSYPEQIQVSTPDVTYMKSVDCSGDVNEPVNAWINEFHYDNEGTDAGEYVEVVIENVGDFTLSDFTLSIYNGNGGVVYGTYPLSTFTEGDVMGDYTVFSIDVGGLQNGPDGLALDYMGTILSFISYGGSFVATDGPANGEASVDIGIAEDGSTPVGNSLFLTGIGSQYSDFTWSSGTETFGSVNAGQLIDNGSASPQIIVSETVLGALGYVYETGPGTAQLFSVSGLSLSNDITVTPPADYEISADGINFQSAPIVIPQIGGIVASTSIWVRLSADLAQGDYNNQLVVLESTGAPSVNISCNGTVSAPPALPNAWINEFHYDNAGADLNEMVEVVIENIGSYSLSDFTLTLYNGDGGVVYDSYSLSTFDVGNSMGSYFVFSKSISGIQNGPDGFALDYEGHVISFISYAGSFTAADGPAAGLTSDDIGIVQDGTSPADISVYLSGIGSQYSDFTWELGESTTGNVNNNQLLDSGFSFPQLYIIASSTFTNMGYAQNLGPGVSKTFTVSGIMLGGDIVISPSAHYEISANGVDFQSTDIVLSAASGYVTPATITVRLMNNLLQGDYNNEEIEIFTSGIGSEYINCSGTVSEPVILPNAWINEIHYDNASVDVNEMVEIVVEKQEDFDLSKLRLSLYDGATGTVYGEYLLSDFIVGESFEDFTVFSYNFSDHSESLQNGPDGFSLDYDGHLIEFISYEGVINGELGAAAGYTSTDIGVRQTASNHVGQSLQLMGWGTASDYFWWDSNNESRGTINQKQVLLEPSPVVPVNRYAIVLFFVLVFATRFFIVLFRKI